MKSKLLFPLVIVLYLLAGCQKEEYVYPSVITEFADVRTDENGTLAQLLTDKGETWNIQPREGLGGLAADSIYRTVSVYQPLGDMTEKTVQLYSCQLVLSPVPIFISDMTGIKTDPVSLQSIWQSGGYLNMVLEVLAKDASHNFHFIDGGITLEEDGSQILKLQLFHDRGNDAEAFTRRVYLSVPLWPYRDMLFPGDKIKFTLNTYEEGTTSRMFDY